MKKTYAAGIDLGTTNSAMAIALEEGAETLPITQITGPNRIAEEKTFASALFLPHEGQFPPESFSLPWDDDGSDYVAGNFAREIGAQVPDRLVSSAKSWLNHRGIDPRSAVLPWKSELVEKKISPFDATRHFLRHMRQVLGQAGEKRGFTADLAEAQVVLTVPASFDEAARVLTAQAAVEAGWGDEVVMLEEPQAAFYAWLGSAGSTWREQVHAGDLILICDVGGGTTDFSLIAVSQSEGDLELERISVGRHILLGGDNMDLALAYALRQKIAEEGNEIDEWQFLSLVHASRTAKERLFESEELEEIAISVPASGAGLLAGTVSTTLTRELLQTIVIDGFFAVTGPDEMPRQEVGAGLREFGLSYDPEPVLSKHIAEFLTQSRASVLSNKKLSAKVGEKRLAETILLPDAILFNGGVFRAPQLRHRVAEILRSWMPTGDVRELTGVNLDLAVAHGAALYGHTKISGKGIRIRSGVARSYYIGLESSMPSIPGYRPPIKAVCVAEQGMEEGDERVLEDREFGLLTGATVVFRFFCTQDRAGDRVGTIIENAEAELEETSSLEMTLPVIEEMGEKASIPVKLHSRLSELGILRLWMQHTQSTKKWELEFSVRTQ